MTFHNKYLIFANHYTTHRSRPSLYLEEKAVCQGWGWRQVRTRHWKVLGWNMCVHVEFWGCGYAVIAAERTAAKSEEEAGIDGGCVLKETRCKVPGGACWDILKAYKRAAFISEHHLGVELFEFYPNTEVCSYRCVLAMATITPPLEIQKFMFIYKSFVSQNPINNTRNKYSAAQQQTKKSRWYGILFVTP